MTENARRVAQLANVTGPVVARTRPSLPRQARNAWLPRKPAPAARCLRDAGEAVASPARPRMRYIRSSRKLPARTSLDRSRLLAVIRRTSTGALRPSDRDDLAHLQRAQRTGCTSRGSSPTSRERACRRARPRTLRCDVARPPERAALVAEELATHELPLESAAVDGHDRAVSQRRVLVNRARHQLLARAGLTGDHQVCPRCF